MLTLHLVNRVLAALLALAVVAAAVVLCVEVVRWAVDSPPWVVPWQDWWPALRDLRADDPALLAVCGAAVALGLLLLLFELKPRRPDALPTAPLADGIETVATRSGVRTAAVTAARDVAGVRGATAEVGRRRVSVTARTPARGRSAELRTQVRERVEAGLADLALERRPKVSVRVEGDG